MSRERQESAAVLHRRSRRFPRKCVNLDAEFSPVNIRLNVPHNINTITGLIKNISPAGLFAELPLLYRVGTRFQVRVSMSGVTETFYVIVWRVDLQQDNEEKGAGYGHGMKITKASEETLHTIIDYIANNR